MRADGRSKRAETLKLAEGLARKDHVDEDDLTKRYPIVDGMGSKQMALVINESGLYVL